ncbi:MAG: hypothetical protein D6824_01345, partial [Planctomycetota bacterium]
MAERADFTAGFSDAAKGPAGARRKRLREVTLSSVVFGVVVGALMNASITYAGLKIGFTIVGSAIAAVLGFGVLRGLLRKGSILETNIAQTIASAVNTPNAGVIFTVPVLLLLGYQLSLNDVDFWLLTLACVAGAVLGCAFIIPLRKQMIDIDRLRFPEGTAVGAILKSPGAGAKKAAVLLVGIILGALLYAPAALSGIRTPAALDHLDGLVKHGKITEEDALRTRTIAQWIEQRQAPQQVTARGEALAKAHALSDPSQRRDAASQAPPLPKEWSWISDDLAVAAYEAATGRRSWSSLRSRKLGWAAAPLWGYSDLNIRLPAEPAPAGETADNSPLSRRVDRDRDGRPDLIVTDES